MSDTGAAAARNQLGTERQSVLPALRKQSNWKTSAVIGMVLVFIAMVRIMPVMRRSGS